MNEWLTETDVPLFYMETYVKYNDDVYFVKRVYGFTLYLDLVIKNSTAAPVKSILAFDEALDTIHPSPGFYNGDRHCIWLQKSDGYTYRKSLNIDAVDIIFVGDPSATCNELDIYGVLCPEYVSLKTANTLFHLGWKSVALTKNVCITREGNVFYKLLDVGTKHSIKQDVPINIKKELESLLCW